jgi:hypothetical protein
VCVSCPSCIDVYICEQQQQLFKHPNEKCSAEKAVASRQALKTDKAETLRQRGGNHNATPPKTRAPDRGDALVKRQQTKQRTAQATSHHAATSNDSHPFHKTKPSRSHRMPIPSRGARQQANERRSEHANNKRKQRAGGRKHGAHQDKRRRIRNTEQTRNVANTIKPYNLKIRT